jgi:repressor LexA
MSNDRSYLQSLQDYYARHRALPSYASIGGLLGLKSKSSVAALVARLKLAGYLESTPDRRLAPTRRFFARPLADASVRAGLPEHIEESAADALTIDDY